jgi:hypothetical protein
LLNLFSNLIGPVKKPQRTKFAGHDALVGHIEGMS